MIFGEKVGTYGKAGIKWIALMDKFQKNKKRK